VAGMKTFTFTDKELRMLLNALYIYLDEFYQSEEETAEQADDRYAAYSDLAQQLEQ
jgi:hypothetical protein